MISHRHVRLSSFRWLLAWAVILCFGAGGTVFGQATCPPGGEPPAIAGLGAGPGNTDRSFGYSGSPNFNTLDASMAGLLEKIGNIIPAPGEIRAIAVQRIGGNANKFIVAGDFVYRVPGTTTAYRNIMRLNANGTIDTGFSSVLVFNAPINAVAVDSLDRIVVGGEFTTTPPTRSRLLRMQNNGALDVAFNPPVPTAAVSALEVEPVTDNVYVGLNGGTIGVGADARANFTRLLSSGATDPTAFWNPTAVVPPAFPTTVNGPVRAIKYAANLFGIGVPGVVVGGVFTQATGGTSQNVGNVALFDVTGQTDFFFPTTGGGANGAVNALAVVEPPPGAASQIFAGGEFSLFNQVARTRVAKFTAFGLDLPFNPPAAAIPNPVRALAFTIGPPSFTQPPPFAVLHVGGQETATAFADVALLPTTGGGVGSLGTASPFFPANPAVVRAIAPNATNGALFGGAFLNARAEKLVATFNSSYNPPTAAGLPSFVVVGPTQFYASALAPNGDLLIAGDVGVPSTGTASPDNGHIVELYRITPCGAVSVVTTFRNLDGYLVRNERDNGTFVSPPANINETPDQGFRRVDFVSPASIRALAVDSQGRIYVGGQFNRVGAVPWNNFVRLLPNGNIDPTFQVGTDDLPPVVGTVAIRRGGPTGFGANGTGLTTVDPETAFPIWNGASFVDPRTAFVNVGEKYNPDAGRVNAIVLDEENGHVYIGGAFKCYNEVPRGGIARVFIVNGQLDQGFGDSSFSVPGAGDYLALQPATVSPAPNINESIRAYLDRVAAFAPLRYFRGRVNAILLEGPPSARRVITAGLFEQANNVPRYNIARYLANGTLDTSFATGPSGEVFPTGTSGLGTTYVAASGATVPNSGATSNGRFGEIFALGRQALGANAGRILVGGDYGRILNQVGAAANLARTAFTRFEPNGRHDASFAQLNFTVAPIVRTIAVKSDDRPLIGGPFLIGPRNFGPGDGIGYINNTTRPRIHRTGVNGTFTDDTDPFGVARSTWMTVPPGTGQNPNAPLVFQPGPYANSANPTNPPGTGLFLGSPASVFTTGTGIEISYYSNLPFNGTPPFGARFVDTAMTVNTITLDPSRRRAYVGGLFNTFESVRTDFQNDSAAAPNGLNLDIRFPAVAALQNGSGCSYGLVLPSFPPFQPIPSGGSFNLGAMNPAGGQMVLATMTRSAVSLCNLVPTITTNSGFVTIVGAIPRATNPGFVDVVINLSTNGTGALRNGSVTVTLPSEIDTPAAQRTVTFNFSQGPASGCTFSSVAVPTSFPTTGGTGQFQITAAAGCAWTITGLPTWISASPLSGSGNGTVNFTVEANTGSPRSATVTVAGQAITITQAGSCTLTLGAPTGTSQAVAGGTGSFTVTTSAGCTYTATSSAPWLVITSGATGGPTGTVNFSVGRNSGAARQATITVTTQGAPAQSVTVSQAPDSGADTVGMFRPSDGFFYLRNTNTSGFADNSFFYGLAADIPLSGDWDGNGVTSIGVFRGGQFLLRNSNTAGVADIPAFSITGTQPGDIPLAGDWDGNGTTTVGLFRGGVFQLRNSNTSGAPDIIINYGLPTDTPIVGDWDGDGVTTIGAYRSSIAFFFLRNSNTPGDPDIQAFFGSAGDSPIAGDWNGNGITTIGAFRAAPFPAFFLRNSNTSGPADITVNYGNPSDRPVVGKWVP